MIGGLYFFLSLVAASTLFAERVRVASYNVQNYLVTNRMVEGTYRRSYPKPEREKSALREVIQSISPDVLVLQEMGSEAYLFELQRDLSSEGLDYAYKFWMNGSDSERHLAMLSRIEPVDVLAHDQVDFKYFEDRIPVKRGLLEARFRSGDVEWCLFGVHLKSRYEDRQDDPDSEKRRIGESRALRDLIRDRVGHLPNSTPALLVGDFNDTKRSRSLSRFLSINNQDFFRMVESVDSRAETWTYRFQREDIYSRIDFILYSELMRRFLPGRGVVVDGPSSLIASDHRMVFVDLSFGP